MNYEVKEQLYEGKAKQVFATNDPEIVMDLAKRMNWQWTRESPF